MQDYREINKLELEKSESEQQNLAKNRAVFAMGSFQEKIEGLVNLFLSVFRNDWYVDFQQQAFKRDPMDPSKVWEIDMKNAHGVFIKNTGTGRIRLFDDLWLLPNEFFADDNQHYRKFFRSINLLLADNINDAEGYAIKGSPGLLTHTCTVVTKIVTSKP